MKLTAVQANEEFKSFCSQMRSIFTHLVLNSRDHCGVYRCGQIYVVLRRNGIGDGILRRIKSIKANETL